jgi:hypothetical protein
MHYLRAPCANLISSGWRETFKYGNNSLLFTDTDAPSHIVYPCADESLIAAAVSTFAASGLRKGDAVALATTEMRRKKIEFRLESETLDVNDLQTTGKSVFLNAEALLSIFMDDGMSDARRFKTRLGETIEAAGVNTANGKPRKDVTSLKEPRSDRK